MKQRIIIKKIVREVYEFKGKNLMEAAEAIKKQKPTSITKWSTMRLG
ncbi:hypothetical protein AAIR98_000873 [Elusimicrobium simillimum]